VPNEDGSRRFLAVRVTYDAEEGTLNRLLWACNETVAEFGFGGLYVAEGQEKERVDRSDFFHFSLAWCLGSDLEGIKIGQDMLDELWASAVADEVRDLKVLVDAVLVKIGNTVHSIPLSGAPRMGTERSGILG
jgi:hypothetical protein